jgi:predicted CxxxxCH...CXXCH cytochrome family protein
MKVVKFGTFVRLLAVACLSWSCGSEGSLGSAGKMDGFTFDGMGGQSQAEKGGASGGASSANSGSVPNPPGSALGGASASAGGSMATGGGSMVSSGAPMAGGGGSPAAGGGSPKAPSSAGASSSSYHQLANWAGAAANNPNHHGRVYFLGNAHKDENGLECASCHGTNYEGGAGPACATCHSEWRSSCSFCHGASALAVSPPRGIYDETTINTLAVGRHSAHLAAGDSHQAFACTTCHALPAANDVDHTLSYKPSTDLSTPGHHGDVTLASIPAGMTWKVDATTGTPASERGSCVGGCHSDGRGGAPLKTPYWAGAAWTNSCANCHASQPKTGHHGHALSNGGTCANCHSGSTTTTYAAATHLDGQVQYLASIAGQGMTLKADATCTNGVRCNGTCHGNNEGHNNQCW